jgi:predicted Rossmann fold nucleotide-binding protein DprA/Smf involved in DNA uptake
MATCMPMNGKPIIGAIMRNKIKELLPKLPVEVAKILATVAKEHGKRIISVHCNAGDSYFPSYYYNYHQYIDREGNPVKLIKEGNKTLLPASAYAIVGGREIPRFQASWIEIYISEKEYHAIFDNDKG